MKLTYNHLNNKISYKRDNICEPYHGYIGKKRKRLKKKKTNRETVGN